MSGSPDGAARSSLDYDALERLRQNHPGWRLLRADHVAMVVSFLDRTFVEPSVRTLSQAEIVSRLDDHLQVLRQEFGEAAFPKTSAEYLDDWANDRHAWLRKFYPRDTDEPHYDLSSGAQSAIVWLSRLGQRQFVGTESRLMTVLELLRQIMEGTETSPSARVAELERRQRELQDEIDRLKAGGAVALLDPSQIRDRFQQMSDTALGLLSDFRDVEASLSVLDRRMRENIATWDRGKGALIGQMFDERDAIRNSDTGRSFRAFWEFIMAPDRQDALAASLEHVLSLEAVQQLPRDPKLGRIHHHWLNEGETTQRTVGRLSERLRQYLDDRAFLESRRILELVRRIEQVAIAVRDNPPPSSLLELDEPSPDLALPFERPLFTPSVRPILDGAALVEGDEGIDASALFEQVHIDKGALRAHIRQMLQREPSVSLGALIKSRPLEHGLAELLTYLGLATDEPRTVVDESATETFLWTDRAGRARVTRLPVILFQR